MIDNYIVGIPSLPIEIQEVILKSLTFQQRLESSMTCKAWRFMILNWPGMWRNLSTDDEHTIVPDLVPYKPYIASHFVKRVHIVDYYNGDPWHAVEDFLLNELKCDAIQDIEVRTEALSMTNISRLLSNCSNTLTSICFTPPRGEIQFERFPTDVTPDLFLHHCPNLVNFTFVYAVSPKAAEKSIKKMTRLQNHNLTSLTLSMDQSNFDPEPYFKLAPNLKRLALLFPDLSRQTNATTFMSMLHQHCPQLISLALSGNNHYLGDLDISELHERRQIGNVQQQPLPLVVNSNNNTPKQKDTSNSNLMDILLHDSLSMYRLAPSLITHIIGQDHIQSTIASLDLAGDAFVKPEVIDYLTSRGGFPSVTHLTLRYESTDSFTRLPEFIGSPTLFPNLRYFHIRESLYNANDYILLALTNMVHLEELKLENCFNFTSKGLGQFLNQMSYLQPNRSLCKLTIGKNLPAFDTTLLLNVIAGKEEEYNDTTITTTTIGTTSISSSTACQQQQQKVLLEELTLDQPDKIKLDNVQEFLEIMRKNGKTMNKLHFTLNCFFDASPDFLETDQGKLFLNNLDHVAKKEWTFEIKQKTIQEALVTHHEYRSTIH